MSMIITLGYGYDSPTLVIRQIGQYISGTPVFEDKIEGTLRAIETPQGSVFVEPIPVGGVVIESSLLVGEIATSQPVTGYIREGGVCMSIEGNKITMFLRDNRTLALTVNDEDRTPVDLDSCKLWFTVKQRTSDPDANALLMKKNTAAGGGDTQIRVLTPSTDGKAEIYLVPTDTDLINPGVYVYDVQVTLANGKTYTITRDQIVFKEDVTKTKT